MSREILFRGKSKEDYGLIYKKGDWVQGNLIEGVGGKDDYYINPKGTLINIRVEAETVGQYIGVKDFKNNPVYEDDILVDQGLDEDMEKDYGTVYWNEECAGFFIGFNLNPEMDAYDARYYTVVGNVWDNPELVEKIS